MDPLTSLPQEVGLQILSYLKPEDLVSASHASKDWNNFCLDRSIPKLNGSIRKIFVENWWYEWVIVWKVVKFISQIDIHKRGRITFQHPESKDCFIEVDYGCYYEYWDRPPDVEETHELQMPLPKDRFRGEGYRYGVSFPTSREKAKGEFCNQIQCVIVKLPYSVQSRHRHLTSKLEFIVDCKYMIQGTRHLTTKMLKIVILVAVVLANLAILYRSLID